MRFAVATGLTSFTTLVFAAPLAVTVSLEPNGPASPKSRRSPAAAGAARPPRRTEGLIDLWPERIRAGPQEIPGAIGLIPTGDEYRIVQWHDSLLDLAGSQVGGVVTGVSGQVVGDVERDRQLFDGVTASGLARIEVRRDGRAIATSFPRR